MNRIKKIIINVLCIAMVFGVLTTHAKALESNSIDGKDLIKDAVLLKKDGTKFLKDQEIGFDQSFKIKYEFYDISATGDAQAKTVESGKAYYLGDIPEYLTTVVQGEITWDVFFTGTQDLLGKATCTNDGKLYITFDNNINDADAISNTEIELEIQLDKNKCGN